MLWCRWPTTPLCTDHRVLGLCRVPTVLCRCQAKRRSPPVGGEPVNQAVAAVFAALCWHSQCIREQLVTYGKQGVSPGNEKWYDGGSGVSPGGEKFGFFGQQGTS